MMNGIGSVVADTHVWPLAIVKFNGFVQIGNGFFYRMDLLCILIFLFKNSVYPFSYSILQRVTRLGHDDSDIAVNQKCPILT